MRSDSDRPLESTLDSRPVGSSRTFVGEVFGGEDAVPGESALGVC